jgi:hypothetical protein
MPELDWTNRPVPTDEAPDAVIKVWRVELEPTPGRFDYQLVRGWQAMLDLVRNQTESVLEDDDNEPEEGVVVKVRLVEMTRQEYDELDTD